jgi:hypothetical protein
MIKAKLKKIMFVLLIPVLTANPCFAGKKSKLTPEQESGVILLALAHRGYIEVHLIDPNPLIFFEPKAWEAMLHRDKHNFCVHALRFIQGVKAEKGKNWDYVFIKDLTSKAMLATIYLDNNKIKIHK